MPKQFCPYCKTKGHLDLRAHVRDEHPRDLPHWLQTNGFEAMVCKSCGSTGFPPAWGKTVAGNTYLGCEFCANKDVR